jgi:hypothetical protein
MKKLNVHLSLLQVVYLVIYVILFCVIIYIPQLISNPVHITKKIIIEEEIIEGSLLGILFILSVWLLNLYKNEAFRQKELLKKIIDDKKSADEKLDDSFKYIGQINVQIQQIKSIFNNNNKLPKTKNDFKKTLFYFSERVFGIVNANWVLFRIINCNTCKTIYEQFETRHGYTFDYPHISNKSIIEKQSCSPFTTVISNPQNFNILVCSILPVDKISNDEQVFIQAITNEITMIFVILNSTYYKKLDNLLTEKTSAKSNKETTL